jgi:hypothetical protein
VGELSSKYAYDKSGKQFEEDIQKSIDECEANYKALVEFAKSRDLTPDKLKKLVIRLIEELNLS